MLTTSSWVIHHDVDEFLMVDAPGWSSSLPSPVARSPSLSEARPPHELWTYPLHSLFSQLRQATCVPVLRYPFQNYGVRELAADQFVTEELTVRDRVPPAFHTYGKVSPRKCKCSREWAFTSLFPRSRQIFLHSDRKPGVAGWLGPREFARLYSTLLLVEGVS